MESRERGLCGMNIFSSLHLFTPVFPASLHVQRRITTIHLSYPSLIQTVAAATIAFFTAPF